MCCFSIEITRGQTHSVWFQTPLKNRNAESFTSAEPLCILPRNICGKEEEKSHWKPTVKMNLPAGRVKNHTYQGDFVQGEEMRAGHI